MPRAVGSLKFAFYLIFIASPYISFIVFPFKTALKIDLKVVSFVFKAKFSLENQSASKAAQTIYGIFEQHDKL